MFTLHYANWKLTRIEWDKEPGQNIQERLERLEMTSGGPASNVSIVYIDWSLWDIVRWTTKLHICTNKHLQVVR